MKGYCSDKNCLLGEGGWWFGVRIGVRGIGFWGKKLGSEEQ